MAPLSTLVSFVTFEFEVHWFHLKAQLLCLFGFGSSLLVLGGELCALRVLPRKYRVQSPVCTFVQGDCKFHYRRAF